MGSFSPKRLTQNTDEWGTPKKLFDKLNQEFNFTLDASASFDNHKVNNYFDIEKNGLSQNWNGIVWCNPPYSNVKEWIKKSYEESEKGAVVVLLIFSKTDTKYWHDFVMKADEIRFVKGRIPFEKNKDVFIKNKSGTAPAPSCIIVFKKNNKQSPTISSYVWR
jgi:site-specific DNA-methyltransferase (adenine-specific)